MGWFNKLTGKEKTEELTEEEKTSGDYEVKELQDEKGGEIPPGDQAKAKKALEDNKDVRNIDVNEEKENEIKTGEHLLETEGGEPDPNKKATNDPDLSEKSKDDIEQGPGNDLGAELEEDPALPKHVHESEEQTEAEEASTDLTANDVVIKEIKVIRLGLDAIHSKAASHFGGRSEISKCVFVSKAWLGKVLAQLGTPNPYPKAKTIRTIPPTQDVADVNLYAFGLKDELEKVNYLRDQLQLSVDEIDSLDFDDLKIINPRLLAIARTSSYINACEARFALGNELAIIRNR